MTIYKSIDSEVEKPGDFPWIEGIHQRLDGGVTNKARNGTTAVYTNDAVQMIVNTIYDGGEHPMIRDKACAEKHTEKYQK